MYGIGLAVGVGMGVYGMGVGMGLGVGIGMGLGVGVGMGVYGMGVGISAWDWCMLEGPLTETLSSSFEGPAIGSFEGPRWRGARPSLPTCRGSWNFIFWSNLSYINSNYLPKDQVSKWLHKGMAWG